MSQDNEKNGLEEYTNILSQDSCDKLIDMFNNDTRKEAGSTAGGVSDNKISTDLGCNFNDVMDTKYNNLILPGIVSLVKNIKEEYDFLDWGVSFWNVSGDYNIQHYKDNEGYFAMHCEHSNKHQKRMMAWMIYLNDAKCGTIFPYQNTTIEAEKGKGVIWSAEWTHPHKGVTPNIGDKYIATGWFDYYTPKETKSKGFK